VKRLLTANPTITHAAVATPEGRVLYQTKNWDVSKDIRKVLADWVVRSPAIVLCDVRYSVLQCTPERLVSTNVSKKGHLVGAITPEGHFLLTHTSSNGNYQVSYMDTARAADQMKPGGEAPKINNKDLAKAGMSLEDSKIKVPNMKKEEKKVSSKKGTEKGKADGAGSSLLESLLVAKLDKSSDAPAAPAGISPALYQEIKNFQTWIYDPLGLPAYIDYALWQSDQVKIAKLAELYRKMAQIFNFPT
jgi:hypothetical protein